MMIIRAPQTIEMEREAGRLGEALQTMGQHLGAEVADLLAAQAQLDDAEGPVRQVDDGAREGFVQGRVGVPEAREPGQRRPEGAAETGPQREKGVFGAVVVVDCGRRREVWGFSKGR